MLCWGGGGPFLSSGQSAPPLPLGGLAIIVSDLLCVQAILDGLKHFFNLSDGIVSLQCQSLTGISPH
jgi:hypothetical protein